MAHFPALMAALCLQATPIPPAPPPALFELPPGPAADAVAAVTPSTPAHATPADLGAPGSVPAYPRGAWSKPATWSAWSELLAAERRAGGAARADPERRARLALLAHEQGRSDEAWAHFARTGVDPTWTAALLPRFLPGVPAGSPAGVGGLAGALPDGAVLAPSLPPPTSSTRDGRIDRRAMSVASIRIGLAVVSMRVAVESEGVQIDVRHVSGGPARLAVLIPEPADYGFANEYVDWYRQDVSRVPHAIEVKPGDEEHVFYGRFEPRERRWPANVPAALPAQLEIGGLWLVAGDDEDKALLASVAKAIAHVLGFPCRVRAPGDAPGWSGITVDLVAAPERAAKLAWLASAVERFALAAGSSR